MLSAKQSAIINFLREYPPSCPPTVREIGAAVGLRSSATVHTYLTRLEAQGLIERKPGCPRCITVVRRD
ncbi:MarR family transcriptional regulator [Sporomusa malonica]|uniref:LexA DNA binding domain-containing protein n=1 Tax=Sporomusa malonica TaxID=112901 RepID=A0A1W2AR02_9FIRM|nr:MarR family transcriptional regulator [Sporomusa malonica]SMC62942.1 LexA DNA binding domain-containing protein [Sporomusa malonica]